jgi:hypothetical protein
MRRRIDADSIFLAIRKCKLTGSLKTVKVKKCLVCSQQLPEKIAGGKMLKLHQLPLKDCQPTPLLWSIK